MLCFEWGELLPAAGQEKVSCQSTKALQTKGRAISEIILQLQKAQEFLQINMTKAESSRQESSTAEHQRTALRIYPKRKAAVSQQKLYCTSCRDWESKSQMKMLKCSSNSAQNGWKWDKKTFQRSSVAKFIAMVWLKEAMPNQSGCSYKISFTYQQYISKCISLTISVWQKLVYIKNRII